MGTVISYREAEGRCEASFLSGGPFWHLCTSGKDTPSFLLDDQDFVFMMNILCLAEYSVEKCGVVSFVVMSNHIHVLLTGKEKDVIAFFSVVRRKLRRYLRSKGNAELPRTFTPFIKPIDNLSTMRNTIAYIHRNGYVVNPKFTPFSYPWGTGRFFFNDIPVEKKFGELTYTEKRKMFHGRCPEIPEDMKILDGYISPSSFCQVDYGMAMFRDAHHYFSMVSKNVEAYSSMAVEFSDTKYLTDQEVYALVARRLKEGGKNYREISKEEKIEMARKLHYDYRISNDQIRRTLNLSKYEVDSLFPLSSK